MALSSIATPFGLTWTDKHSILLILSQNLPLYCIKRRKEIIFAAFKSEVGRGYLTVYISFFFCLFCRPHITPVIGLRHIHPAPLADSMKWH